MFEDKYSFPMPDLIIFDWDNTLVHSWPVLQKAMNMTLSAMGHAEWSEVEAKKKIQKSLKDSFPSLFGEEWLRAKDIFYQSYEACHLTELSPILGCETALKGLCSLSIPLAVFSNKRGDLLRGEVDALGWGAYFSQVYGAGDFPEDKPSIIGVEKIFQQCLKAENDRECSYFVGDSPVDIECGQKAGMIPVLIEGSVEKEDKIKQNDLYFRIFDEKNVVSFENCSAFYNFVKDISDRNGIK